MLTIFFSILLRRLFNARRLVGLLQTTVRRLVGLLQTTVRRLVGLLQTTVLLLARFIQQACRNRAQHAFALATGLFQIAETGQILDA